MWNQVSCCGIWGGPRVLDVTLTSFRTSLMTAENSSSLYVISEEVKPHPMVVNMLTEVEEIIPKWKIVPSKNVIDTAFKDPIKRETVWTFNSSCSNLMIRKNKLIYQDKPGLKTALEMLRTSISLERDLNEVTLPFFVLHGEADIVTDPEVSKALSEKSSSGDKTIKLYPGMWHGLTSGEPDENIEIVFTDITAWLDKQLL
ncbi:hypothetical protein Godav_011740 [Gossypium davidsonii]|uniref:Serine aminopeptidase S33 domain-containing protein n=2 Tax=Gossypium TaxID=3633 RepID=A0A7J8RB06_GOSDV|nr:hypothetical protein [Gossypium davidsonii]